MKHIQDLLEQQDLFFSSKKTLSIEFRKKSLVKLRKEIKQNENAILNALHQDLRKPKFEAYTSEIGLVINELDYFIKNIAKLSKPKRVKSALLNFPSTDYIYSDPYGRDRYFYDKEANLLKGKKTGRSFRLGQNILVTIANVSPEERKITLVPKEKK